MLLGSYLGILSLLAINGSPLLLPIFGLILSFLFIYFSSIIYKREMRLGQHVRTILFDLGIEKPVLYLRSFKADNTPFRSEGTLSLRFSIEWFHKVISGTTIEKELTEIMVNFGTPVAIGDKKDKLDPWGASRIHSSDDNWKDRVIEYSKKSSKIFIMVDSTPSLIWEIKTLPKIVDNSKIIFIFPPRLLHSKYKLSKTMSVLNEEVPLFKDLSYDEIVKKKVIGFSIVDGLILKSNSGYYKSISSYAFNNQPKIWHRYNKSRHSKSLDNFLLSSLIMYFIVLSVNGGVFHLESGSVFWFFLYS